MAGSRVVILGGVHLCHNPRVLKEASALSNAGYRVTVLGGWSDSALKRRDRMMVEIEGVAGFRFVPVVDLTKGGLHAFVPRVSRKLGMLAAWLGLPGNLRQLGYAYPALREVAFKLNADLYIAHSEQGMAVGLDLLRAGRRVAVDMEDWYSEDLPPAARRTRPVGLLRRLECALLRRAAYATCPSVAMSAVLAATYDCPPPRVLYNAFPWADRDGLGTEVNDRRDPAVPSIYWFSQTIGSDRGLGDLLSALPCIEPKIEIHLRGRASPAMRVWLSSRIPEGWHDRVFVHDLEANDRLLARISEHDIGFAGEMTLCRSREVTVTNKILHYLLGGLAVVASDTEGQREVASAAGNAVLIYPQGDPRALADRINSLLASPDGLAQAKADARRAAERRFCWERQEPELLAAVEAALRVTQDRCTRY